MNVCVQHVSRDERTRGGKTEHPTNDNSNKNRCTSMQENAEGKEPLVM